MSCATTATTRTWSSRPTRAPPRSPTSPTDLGRVRLLAGRRIRLGRLGRLRPQGDGDHRPRGLGVGQAPLPRARRRRPDDGRHRGRDRRHVRRRLRQRHAPVPAPEAGRRLQPPARLPRSRPRPRGELRRARAPLRAPALDLGGLRPDADLNRRRCLPAHRQVDRALARGPRGARDRRRALDAERADQGILRAPRSTCSGTGASAPT